MSGVQGNVAYVLEIWLKCTTLLDTTGVYQIRIDSGASDITSQVSSIRQLANNDYVESKIVNVSTATITVPATSEYTPIFSMICQ